MSDPSTGDEFDRLLSEVGETDDNSDENLQGSLNPDPITLDEAVDSLYHLVDTATDFITSDMMPEWEDAEAYYDGASDIPKVKGRSQITQTVVRDAIRSVKPSLLRVFAQADSIVRFKSYRSDFAPIAKAQSVYVEQVFWDNDGFSVLNGAVHNALLKKGGIMKAAVEYTDDYRHYQASRVDDAMLNVLSQAQDLQIVSVNPDNYGTYAVEVVERTLTPKFKLYNVPLYNFFISDDATSCDDARVIGERTSMPIGDAVKMGLEADWEEFDDEDPETLEGSEESRIRRGYLKDRQEDNFEADPMMRRVLITEVYCRFDLAGIGIPQLYKFYLGGTNYKYIYHEEVEEQPYSCGLIDEQPHAFFGRSLYDILKENQDSETALIRATMDNAYLANNRRLAVHETMVNMNDVISSKIGAPIRVRAPGMIQEIGTEPMIGTMLPLMQYVHTQGLTKAGITEASLGLDPDALQSTDKAAVQNTIQLGQGQVEYMARTFAETGLVPLFRKMLRLSQRHISTEQLVQYGSKNISINPTKFDAELPVRVKVGLGNADRLERMQALDMTIQYQKEILNQFGLQNPFVTYAQHYKAMQDRATLAGIDDIEAYFTNADEEALAQFQQQMDQKAAESAPADPSESLIQIEQIKAEVKREEMATDAQIKQLQINNDRLQRELDRRSDLVKTMMEYDYKQDALAQKLELDAAKLEDVASNNDLVNSIKMKQEENNAQAAAARSQFERNSKSE